MLVDGSPVGRHCAVDIRNASCNTSRGTSSRSYLDIGALLVLGRWRDSRGGNVGVVGNDSNRVARDGRRGGSTVPMPEATCRSCSLRPKSCLNARIRLAS